MACYIRSMKYFRADAAWIALLVVMIGLSVGAGVLQAWPLAVLVDVVVSNAPRTAQNAQINWAHNLFLAPLPSDRLSQIIGLTLIGMFIKITQDGLWMLRAMVNKRINYNGTTRIRGQLFEKYQMLGMDYHKSQPQGEAIYRISTDAFGPFGILDTFIGAATAAVTLACMTAIMLSRNAPLTAFALGITPLLVLVNRRFAPAIKQRSAESKQADADLMSVIQRAMSSIFLTQAFRREQYEQRQFGAAVDRSVAANWRLNWQEYLYPFAIQLVFALGAAVIFGYGGYLVYRDQILHPIAGGVTPGDLMVFLVYIGQLWDPLGLMLGFTAKVQIYAAASERVFRVLDQPTDIKDAPNAIPLPVKARVIEFSNVSFSYPNTRNEILSAVNLRIEPGELVAFAGGSGAGKSTLINLLLRFYDPTRGAITLDGIDIRSARLADVRRHFSLVSQDGGLFHGTIAANVAYGCADATPLEIAAAAEMAGAAEFIEKLPDRYATELSDGGQNLSGGQRQRIAIARALLTHAPVLVLDEPTSALDPYSEQTVIQSIHALRGKRTIILVTHRLQCVASCEQIFVLKNGIVSESGTHSELMQRNGAYADMLRTSLADDVTVTNSHNAGEMTVA